MFSWPFSGATQRAARRTALSAALWATFGATIGAAATARADMPPHPAVEAGTDLGYRAGTLRGRVAGIVAGDGFRLATGVEVRLAGTVAPYEDLTQAAGDALGRMVLGREVVLAFPAGAVDRHGRLEAQARLGSVERVGERMVEAGWLRVSVRPGAGGVSAEDVARLLAAEARARAARRGVWRHPAYRVLPARRADSATGRFAVIEGRVLSVNARRRTVYLDFGRNWRDTFTVGIDRGDLPRFVAAGTDPAAYAGRRVRVRGWIEQRNGPYMRVGHPLAIEMLGDD